MPPLTEGEGILIADLDMGLILKRKRMMDSVGHYAAAGNPEIAARRPSSLTHADSNGAAANTI